MAILLPALKAAKKRACAISCVSNQKQTIQILYQYADDFNGVLTRPLTSTSPYRQWGYVLNTTGYISGGRGEQGDANFNLTIIKCPQMLSPAYHCSYTYALAGYYEAYETSPGHYGWWGDGCTADRIPLFRFKKPCEQPVVVDSVAMPGVIDSGAENYRLLAGSNVAHCRHFSRANIAYGDGSVLPTSESRIRELNAPANAVYVNDDFRYHK